MCMVDGLLCVLQCSRTTALDVFFEQILSETEYQKLAVIGAGCSLATEPTAEISHQFNITQVCQCIPCTIRHNFQIHVLNAVLACSSRVLQLLLHFRTERDLESIFNCSQVWWTLLTATLVYSDTTDGSMLHSLCRKRISLPR